MEMIEKINGAFSHCPECGALNENITDDDLISMTCHNCRCNYEQEDLDKRRLWKYDGRLKTINCHCPKCTNRLGEKVK